MNLKISSIFLFIIFVFVQSLNYVSAFHYFKVIVETMKKFSGLLLWKTALYMLTLCFVYNEEGTNFSSFVFPGQSRNWILILSVKLLQYVHSQIYFMFQYLYLLTRDSVLIGDYIDIVRIIFTKNIPFMFMKLKRNFDLPK